jgi:c-di-GMP-binding flagellar brake protein YcgR
MSDEESSERRRHPRVKTTISLELHSTPQSPPLRTSTNEISLCGCYIETMFTMPVGTKLDLIMWVEDQALHTKSVVTTCYPQVGNGIEFAEMTNEDRARLDKFLQTLEEEQGAKQKT